MSIYGRTDIASEAHKIWNDSAEENTKLSGVAAKQEKINELDVTAVEILDNKGAKALNKPRGKYYTLELQPHFERGAECFPAAADAIAQLIRRCVDLSGIKSILIAALGNPDVTPDALGSLAASSILVTRHLKLSSPKDFEGFRSTVLCRTGVLGTTGIESAAQIRSLCEDIHPDCVIAIDAMAGADPSRLCKSVQISSTGIAPGSGVGNNREQLNAETLGVPVIAIGVPTVVDAATLSKEQDVGSMFVTPRSIDSDVRAAGRLIAYGIDLALHDGLTVFDIDMLVG